MDMAKKMKSKQLSLPATIGIGIGAALILSGALSALAAFLMSTEKMQVSSIPVCIAITHLLSAFSGTWLACRMTKEKRLLTGGITALGYILFLLATTAILLGGQYSGIGTGILTALLGGGAAVLTGLRKGKRRSRKHKIPAYR